MLIVPNILVLILGGGPPVAPKADHASAEPDMDPVGAVYAACGLCGEMGEAVFREAWYRRCEQQDSSRILAIADMTLPSTEKRLFVIDLAEHRLLLRTWVAHGEGSGVLTADRFSNADGSHCTSLGLYRVGEPIMSPKHGESLLLYGLDPGLNDQALSREIILHSADYVSADFICANGRLGRSWGCPAVSKADMFLLVDLLPEGLLYVHGR